MADPTFAMLIDQSGFFKVKINDLFWTNLFVTFVFFSGIYSLLRTKLVKTVVVVSKEKWQTEAKIITSLVAGLFFVFGVIQIRYLVTPLAVLQKAGITLSEFTKRGYTEMLIASVLAFTMIIILENWTHKQGSRKLRIFFVGEIIWLIVSATRRNYLYQSSFGLTQARIVGAFLSLWLLIAAFLYIKKIASKLDNGWLIKYFVLASCWVLILLNAINSERIIAVNRPPTLGYGIDYQYLAQSSADGYEGWEKSLSFVEKEIASKKMMYIDEYIVADSVVNSLTSKYAYELGPQAEHYWHNYGSWNMSSKLARRYLLDNWQRLLTAQKELSIIGKQFN